MSEETKEYPFEKTFDVKFDESALKTFNDLIKEKGITHFKLESDLYGILDVVSYEEYEKLQQKVEQLEKEIDRLNNIINELEKYLKENIKLTKTAVHFEILDDYDTRKYKRDIALFEMVLDKLKELKENNK